MELSMDPLQVECRVLAPHTGLLLLAVGNSWWVGLKIHLTNFSCPSSKHDPVPEPLFF